MGMRLEVPEVLSGARVRCGKAASALTEEHDAAGGGKYAGVIVLSLTGHGDLPGFLSGLDIEGPQDFFGGIRGIDVAAKATVLRLAINRIIFNRHHIDEPGVGAV